MRVGVNYPWLDYGWDFGLPPPQWRGEQSEPRWYGVIDEHLQRFLRLGLSVVRWFILADGLTYGTGPDAPHPDPARKGEWRFDSPPLSEELVRHFAELLRRFARANSDPARPIQLLPVLIDFHFCEPGLWPSPQLDLGWVKQGRADALNDAGKRVRFLDHVLDPLLRASQEHPDLIYAWELINEPEWVTRAGRLGWGRNRPVGKAAMRAFLDEGMTRIRRHGFAATVGFASSRTLRRSGIAADIDQFHHYAAGRRRLPRHAFDPQSPCVIGEFSTSTSDAWPELRKSGQTVLGRLQLAEAQGYPLAIPWSFLAADPHSSWPEAEAALERFARLRPDPANPSGPPRL
jgi:hypothetical protein